MGISPGQVVGNPMKGAFCAARVRREVVQKKKTIFTYVKLCLDANAIEKSSWKESQDQDTGSGGVVTCSSATYPWIIER